MWHFKAIQTSYNFCMAQLEVTNKHWLLKTYTRVYTKQKRIKKFFEIKKEKEREREESKRV